MSTKAESDPEGDLSVLKAFPTAEGAGAIATGGRGGIVYEVTTLADYNDIAGESPIVGSLRYGLSLSGARTIVFRVGGPIYLKARLRIDNSNLTVAGQTAPGDGIQIVGKTIEYLASGAVSIVWLNAENVIWQYTRFHDGLRDPSTKARNDCVDYAKNGNNAIFDHCTFAWSHDEIFTTSMGNVSIQYCILAETLQGHSCGGMYGTVQGHPRKDADYHKNLIANMSHRMMRSLGLEYRFTNNIVYNWGLAPSHGHVYADEVGNHDFVGNVFKTGPATPANNAYRYAIGYCTDDSRRYGGGTVADDPKWAGQQVWLYVHDNYSSHYGRDQQEMARVIELPNGPAMDAYSSADWSYPNRRAEPLPSPSIPLNVLSPGDNGTGLDDYLLPRLGVYRHLGLEGTWEDCRDALDARIISEYQTGSGISTAGPTSEDDVGGRPVINGGTAYTSTAGDGIADAWKTRNGLDPTTDYSTVTLTPRDGVAAGWTVLDIFLSGRDLPAGGL